jgi:hypothetical protein
MAEMYRELMEPWDLQYGAQGPEGVRVFQRNDTSGSIAAASLPIVIGTSTMTNAAGTAITGCVCRRYRWKKVSGVAQVTANYSSATTKLGGGGQPPEPGSAVSWDEDMVQWSAGGEVLSIPGDSKTWKWDSDTAAVNQPVFKVVATGTIRLPKVVCAEQLSSFKGFVRGCVGHINSAEFEGYAEGQVLFEGADGGARINSAGVLEYGFDLVFKWRLIGGSVSSADWQYIWREDKGGLWDKPKDPSGGLLYATADFSDLTDDFSFPAEPEE